MNSSEFVFGWELQGRGDPTAKDITLGVIMFVFSFSLVVLGALNIYILRNMTIFHNAFGWFWLTRSYTEVVINVVHVFYSAPVTIFPVMYEYAFVSCEPNFYRNYSMVGSVLNKFCSSICILTVVVDAFTLWKIVHIRIIRKVGKDDKQLCRDIDFFIQPLLDHLQPRSETSSVQEEGLRQWQFPNAALVGCPTVTLRYIAAPFAPPCNTRFCWSLALEGFTQSQESFIRYLLDPASAKRLIPPAYKNALKKYCSSYAVE
uniref:7TM_GPCR_Srx domain-containing protein n=1 Tax=Steinernema glaseri TaxID=37863 RepID=A0A1I8AK20_9BILA